MYEWKDIPPNKIQKAVFKLQKRIYQASLRGDVKAVRKLQRLLMNSWSTKCLAVSRVTQDNLKMGNSVSHLGIRGNGEKFSQLPLPNSPFPILKISDKAAPKQKNSARTVTIYDRALQVLVELALSPEWSAKFSPFCYGFRPGRPCHEAIAAIYNGIVQLPQYVLIVEIAQASYRQNHNAVLKKLAANPSLRRLIKAWLKAGVMDGNQLFPSTEMTPQAGIISPLLAKIAMQVLETEITTALSRGVGKTKVQRHPTTIGYAGNFLVMDEDISVILKAKEIAEKWLSGMGLELQPGTTRVAHTLNEYEGNVGFDFLGCNFRQYKVGKCHSKVGYKTFVKPSKEAIKRHLEQVDDVLKKHKASSTQSSLISALNSVIRVWKSYYSNLVSNNEAFEYLDSVLYQKLLAWAKYRHPNKNNTEIVSKYWLVNQGDGWKFATKEPNNRYVLVKYRHTQIVRDVKVKNKRNPYGVLEKGYKSHD